jgi:hypothetical protein
MKWAFGFVLSIVLVSGALGQQGLQRALPVGTLIPVSLSTALNTDKRHPGDPIHAEVMQDIPGTSVKRRAHVVGHVVSVSRGSNGNARLEFRIDTIKMRRQSIPMATALRALASFLEVQEAQVPEEGASRGITPEVATTTQIGGDQVYRGGGPVAVHGEVVGKPTPWGVVAVPRVHPGMPCRGQFGGHTGLQAFWLFSTDACGVYGLSDVLIEHAGRTAPTGTIVLVSTKGKLNIGTGAALLLRVIE